MMKYVFVFLSFFLPFQIYAFDASCFRESVTFDAPAGIIGISVKNIDDDFFFTSGNVLLPSRLDTTEKNPPLQYTSNDSIDIAKLRDSDSQTVIEVDPYLLGRQDVSYTFDLGTIYPQDTLLPSLGYYAQGKVQVHISTDGTDYLPVSISSMGDFDLRYLRVIFERANVQSDITIFHTLTFYKKIQSRYIVESKGGSINVYASYNCQQGKYREFLSARPNITSVSVSTETIPVELSPNPFYRDDSDTDSIENLQDNCPLISNTDQKDINRDGIGDACADDDSDDIFGASDNCPTLANPDQSDKNVNGTGDACEFDTDKDGIPDGSDNAIHQANPNQSDNDSDRIGDVIDNCSLYNPDQLDLDKNEKGDVCDQDEEYRKTNDSDKDGILDFSDNCQKIPNPNQEDSDADGIGNVCDNCILLQNTDQYDENKNGKGDMCDDIDADGIEGWRDNCPTLANPDQLDSNNDRIGNACSDTDSDRIYDSQDNCPTLYNPEQEDIDKDKIGDLCDNKDDRFLESNKYLFMGLLGFFALLFIGGILFLFKKLQ